jgi:hypothetical protein
MTLDEMASTIRNHVVDGLNGAASVPFSIEQLKDEILLTTSTVILKLSAQGLVDINRLTQRIDGIKITAKDLSANCQVESAIEAPHFVIPNINRGAASPIQYIGTVDGVLSFKVYLDKDYRFHKHRLATARFPFAWVSTTANSDGMYDVFLFNMGKYNQLRFVTIEALFDNPYDLYKTAYFDQMDTAEFYAPAYVQKEVIDTITKEYINYHRQLHVNQAPNTQKT